jgi:hypothetical protein
MSLHSLWSELWSWERHEISAESWEVRGVREEIYRIIIKELLEEYVASWTSISSSPSSIFLAHLITRQAVATLRCESVAEG